MYPVGFIAEVTSLSPKAKEKHLYDFFGHCGAVEHIELVRSGEYVCSAYVTFGDWYALETAVLLSGAKIVDQHVTISYWGTAYAGEFDEQNMSSYRVLDNRCSKVDFGINFSKIHLPLVMLLYDSVKAKALVKAKAFDESYHVSSFVASKLVVLSKRIGLTDTIQSSMDTVKSVDEKYHVSDFTKAAVLVVGIVVVVITKIATAATKVVVKSEYFAKGVCWVLEVFICGVKGAAEIGKPAD